MSEGPQFTREERSGVPILTMPSHDGLCYGGIVFRVGYADEPLPKRGVCHLIEHVVAAFEQDDDRNTNGLTEELFTSFVAYGRPDEVQDHLELVCRELSEFPALRLDRERRILTVEDLAPGWSGPAAMLRRIRCGPTRFGSRTEHEHGVWNMSDADVVQWAQQWFTQGNCVAYLTHPPRVGLDLSLPPGNRMSVPEFSQVDGLETPAQCDGPAERVSLGAVSRVGPARDLVFDAVRARVVKTLRSERGVIYDIECDSDPIDRRRSHSCFSVDVFDSDAAVVRNTVFGALGDLALNGASAEEFDRFQRGCDEDAASFHAGTELDDAAKDDLLGRPLQTPGRYALATRAITVSDVREAAREIVDSTIVAVPPGTPLPAWPGARVKPMPEPKSDDVQGELIPGRRRALGLRRGSSYLVVGPDAAGAFDANDPLLPWVAMRYDDVVLATRHASGDLTLMRGDDCWIRLEAAREREAAAIKTILSRIDAAVLVDTPRRVQARRLEAAAEGKVLDFALLRQAIPHAAEELTATESVHHVVRATWAENKNEGLMIVTDRRIILAGRHEELIGSRSLSDFAKAQGIGRTLTLTDLDDQESEFEIWPESETEPLAQTIDEASATDPIPLF